MNERKLKVWVDADSFAKPARQVLEKICQKNGSLLLYIINRKIFSSSLKSENNREGFLDWILVDYVDDFIKMNSQINDLCITRDIPLASFLLEKGCFVLNDKGIIFTKTLLLKAKRQGSWNKTLSLAGLVRDKTRTYSLKDKSRFCQSLENFFSKFK